MFCPRCAAQNTEEAKFCRSCGADISLVPQAVSGALAERLAAGEDNVRSRARSRWWFWLFIPAFGMLADGVSTGLRLADERKQQQLAAPPFYTPPPTAVPHAPRVNELPPRNTGEMIPPPSVTEGTTRHLGVPVERTRGEE